MTPQGQSPFAGRLAAGCLRQVLIGSGLLFGVVAIFAVAAIAAVSSSSPGHDASGVFGGVLFGLCGLAVVVSLSIGIAVVRRRSRSLDAVFVPIGLVGSARGFVGFRQYHGNVQGRRVDAAIYKGPYVNLSVQTALGAQLSIATSDTMIARTIAPAARAVFGSPPPMSLDRPDLAGLMAFALDEIWARSLLDNDAAREPLLRLLRRAGGLDSRAVYFAPGSLRLQASLPLRALSRDTARGWLEDLLRVVQVAEGLPPPASRSQR